MRKTRFVALVGAGPVSRSFLARLPAVTEHLGPVKSLSFRLASRIANAIRAGFPVADYAEFERTRMVLVSVQARQVARIVDDLATSPVDWRRKTVILCESELDSEALVPLAACGAATASLAPLDGFERKRLLIEGDRTAVLAARRLFGHDVRLVELRSRTKVAYLAGVTFLTELSAPMLSAANNCFRSAGLSSQLAAQVIERLSERTVRAYLRSGRSTSSGIAPQWEVAALERINPELAATYADAVRMAVGSRRRGGEAAANVS